MSLIPHAVQARVKSIAKTQAATAVKTHVATHKSVYIAGGVCFALGALTGSARNRQSVVININPS